MRRLILPVLALLLGLNTACSEYQKVLKSTDPEYKFEKAVEYFEAEKYQRAYPLFDNLLKVYRGTEKAAEVYFYFAETSFYMEDYILAAYHYENFAKTFPNHEKTEDAYYMVGYCYYLQSPRPNLDQTYTMKAINQLQLFVNLYPRSEKLLSANELIESLREKLETKAFERAQLYYKTEHYQAAVVAFNNVLDEYPDTQYREDALYYRLVAAYRLADNSIPDKKLQRFIEARTAYREFLEKYPDSSYRSDIEAYFGDIGEKIEALKNTLETQS